MIPRLTWARWPHLNFVVCAEHRIPGSTSTSPFSQVQPLLTWYLPRIICCCIFLSILFYLLCLNLYHFQFLYYKILSSCIWSFSLRIIKEIEIIAFQVFILFWFLLPLSDPSFICFFKFFCSDLSRILRSFPYVQRSSVSISFFPLFPLSLSFFHFKIQIHLCFFVFLQIHERLTFFLVLSTLKQIYSAPSLVATLILCHRCHLH